MRKAITIFAFTAMLCSCINNPQGTPTATDSVAVASVYDEDKPGSSAPAALRLLEAVSGKEYASCGKSLLRKALDKAEDVPAWPSDGFISEKRQFILIHLQ